MRNLVTATGRRQHIVRENAYHGKNGDFFLALCGVWPKENGIGAPDAPPERRCKNCKRLSDTWARADG